MFFLSGALTAHSIDGHEGPLSGQQVEQLRDSHKIAVLPFEQREVCPSIAMTPSGTQASDAA
jgi:hypothetical protein